MRDSYPALFSVEEERKCWRSRSGGFPWLAVALAKEATADQQNGALESAAPCLCRRSGFPIMLSPKKKIAPVDQPPERLRKSFVDVSLANLGAQEFAVVFYTDAATGQQVGHCRNRLLGAFGAGANGEDKVTEREFGTRFEDLFSRFHDQS
jgi:hypothetical protein